MGKEKAPLSIMLCKCLFLALHVDPKKIHDISYFYNNGGVKIEEIKESNDIRRLKKRVKEIRLADDRR